MAESPPAPLGPSAAVIMAGLSRDSSALQRQYVGTLADADARSLVSRTYNTTKEEAAAVDRIVGSPRTLYMSHGDFARHAIWELLMAYEEAGFGDDFIPDMTAHMKAMREAAWRLQLRQEFQDILHKYETSLIEGLETADWDLITTTLDTLEGYISRTPDAHWMRYIRKTVLRSGVVKQVIETFEQWSNNAQNGTPAKERKQYQIQSERWTLWLESLGENG